MIMTEVQVREILRAFGPLKAFIPIPLQASSASICCCYCLLPVCPLLHAAAGWHEGSYI
jgi:hypothetical protein